MAPSPISRIIKKDEFALELARYQDIVVLTRRPGDTDKIRRKPDVRFQIRGTVRQADNLPNPSLITEPALTADMIFNLTNK
jgi:hypothetical protein